MALNALDSSLVTTGKPVDGGCCYTNFEDSPQFPTDATTTIASLSNWESLGELDENGFTESKSVSTTNHKGWHKKTLLTSIDDETNTYKLAFVEVSRPAVAKLRYGQSAVTADTNDVLTKIADTGYDGTAVPLIIDELESNGYLRRTVIRKAVISSFDDVSHVQGSLMVYGLTFTVNEPDDGSAAIEIFRAKPTTA